MTVMAVVVVGVVKVVVVVEAAATKRIDRARVCQGVNEGARRECVSVGVCV